MSLYIADGLLYSEGRWGRDRVLHTKSSKIHKIKSAPNSVLCCKHEHFVEEIKIKKAKLSK